MDLTSIRGEHVINHFHFGRVSRCLADTLLCVTYRKCGIRLGLASLLAESDIIIRTLCKFKRLVRACQLILGKGMGSDER
jgi:hypothetical protein